MYLILGIENSFNLLRAETIFQFHSQLYIFDEHFSHWGESHIDDEGNCVKAKLSSEGKMTWVKYNCDDISGNGVICAKRNQWETVLGCYLQPSQEASMGSRTPISEDVWKRDPIEFCRDLCVDSRYFDIVPLANGSTETTCHCIAHDVPTGGFQELCTDPECEDGENCHSRDGYKRTRLYRTWKTSCPPLDPDLTTNFVYPWEPHGAWHWGSKVTLRCICQFLSIFFVNLTQFSTGVSPGTSYLRM